MIYPISLYNFGKVCKDSVIAGNVLRRLCKQNIKLSEVEQMFYDMIANDNGWMDERLQVKREKERERKAALRSKNRAKDGAAQNGEVEKEEDVPQCPKDNAGQAGTDGMSQGQTDVPHPSFLPTSLPSSLPTSPESVCAASPARVVKVEGELTVERVVEVATSIMGIPEWYARYWHRLMTKIDWQGRNGESVKPTWRKTLMGYWNRESGEKKAELEALWEARNKKLEPEAFKENDWILCTERCVHCTGVGCLKGIKTPPQFWEHSSIPEECPEFLELVKEEA